MTSRELSTDWGKYIGTSFFSKRVFAGYKKFFSHLKKEWPENAKILELGSATGRLSFWLSKNFPVSEIVLVDSNEKLIKKSKKIFSSANMPVRFIKQDVRDLDLKEKFHLVHSAGLIEHFSPNDQKRIVEIYKKHCYPGTWSIVYAPTPARAYKFWRRAQEIAGCWKYPDEKPILQKDLSNLFSNAGFEIIASNKVWRTYLTEVGVLARLCQHKNQT